MFEHLNTTIPDLILLDILMPEINGFEALKQLKANNSYADIPVIFLTGKKDVATEALGFEMGVVDFISKPFSEPVLLNRIKLHLDIEEKIRDRTAQLELRTQKLLQLQNSLASVLANMVEHRDSLTGRHIERTVKYVKIFLNTMLENNIYADHINGWNFEMVSSASRLHDIGKIVISDIILNKNGLMTEDEFEKMKTHALEGENIINGIIADSGDGYFLQDAKLFAGSHHEKWDGTGYPRKLKGEEIPLLGRIMAIADVYDALVSERPYKIAFTHEEAVEIIADGSGKHFDPELVNVFLLCEKELNKVVTE